MPRKIQPNETKVIWDLDDTLIMTMLKFNKAAFECGRILMEDLGWYAPYAPQILALQQRIDEEFTERFGFGLGKYVACWLETYRLLCEERGFIPHAETEHRLRRAAVQPYIGPFELVPGALDALNAIASEGYDLYMCTIGEEHTQLSKVTSVKLDQFFPLDRVFVESPSKSERLAKIAGDSPERTVMIGDSKKSDILAAQELGIHAVWLECPTQWSYNSLDESLLKPYWRPFDISGVPGVLARICRGESPE